MEILAVGLRVGECALAVVCWGVRLLGGAFLMEVQCTELIGDELQASELEGLGRRERWRSPRSIARDRGELQRAEADRLAVAGRRSGEWSDRNHLITEAVNAQSAPHGRRQNCRCGKWAPKLLNCLIVVRLIGYGLACKDSRI